MNATKYFLNLWKLLLLRCHTGPFCTPLFIFFPSTSLSHFKLLSAFPPTFTLHCCWVFFLFLHCFLPIQSSYFTVLLAFQKPQIFPLPFLHTKAIHKQKHAFGFPLLSFPASWKPLPCPCRCFPLHSTHSAILPQFIGASFKRFPPPQVWWV